MWIAEHDPLGVFVNVVFCEVFLYITFKLLDFVNVYRGGLFSFSFTEKSPFS